MRSWRPLLPALCLLAVLTPAARPAVDEPPLDLAPGPHAVGYRVAYAHDPARSYGPRLDLDGVPLSRPLSRPVQVHLWYPAARADSPPLRYRDYILAAAGPGEGDPAVSGAGPGASADDARAAGILASYRAAPLRRGADEARLDAILARTMRAHRDAAPGAGPFPLILYAPSINCDPFENAVLCELLASHGYVVASAPSWGLQEPEVSRDHVGAVAQVGDLGFVLARVWDEPFVDRAHVGVLGFSWGGMTGLLFAIPHRGIDAVACLDGAATIPRYRPVAESFDCWVPRDLRAALLDVVLADEERLLRYAVLWGPERSQDLLTLLELNLEAYPRSAETHVWLAQAHLALEDEAAARRALETALAIDPGHERGRRLLERLGGG